ncbi:MAG TPA: DUF2889 domain-containing protein [Alphaproteobacteria bacterium]|jgi:hypothetical protein|nr:DUF2889 domain-containing protein [Alphaproteobacteria bacterium]
MPLPAPTEEREHLHTRRVTCRGYRRKDGLWDIEGHIVDNKTYSFENEWRGTVTPDMAVHEMWLRITIDDDMTIRDAVAATEAGPFRICPDIAPNFKKLVGLRIGPGWRKSVQARVGGVEGCTHLVELLGPMATTAFQTQVIKRRNEPRKPGVRPRLLNSCHALGESSEVVKKEWPEFYKGA